MPRIKEIIDEVKSEAYMENDRWERENSNMLAHKYPDMWVAITDKKVVASDRSLDALKKKVEERASSDYVLFRYIVSPKRVYWE